MRDFRRLPWHLRVVSLLGLLCLLASILLFSRLFDTFLSSLSPDSWHVLWMAVNLLILGWTCWTVVRIYRARIPLPDGVPIPHSFWQRQVRAIVWWTALPLCALALAVFIQPTAAPLCGGLVLYLSFAALVVLLAARNVAS